MTKRLTFCLLLIGLTISATIARAAGDPAKLYTDAYILIRDGERAEAKSDWAAAQAKYAAAQNILEGIRKDSPDWSAQMVEFRLKDCATKSPPPPRLPPRQPRRPARRHPQL